MTRRRRRILVFLIFGLIYFILMTTMILQLHENFSTLKTYVDLDAREILLYGLINETVTGYPSELKLYLRRKIFHQAASRYPFNFTTDDLNLPKKLVMLTALEKYRKRILEELMDQTAERYPLSVNVRELSDRAFANKSVPHKPINPYRHGYVHNPTHLCSTLPVYVLILVKSAVKNDHLRHTIRRTWVQDIPSKLEGAKVAFLLGYSHRERFVVESENIAHGDIIQGDFVDAYRNNTLKTMMAYYWTTDYCRNARFIFFVDDDVFVNLDLVNSFLESVTPQMEPTLYSGLPVVIGLPAREPQSKWYISKDRYPHLVYPEYLAGCAFFMSQNSVRRFRSAFPYVDYLPFDDVYLGIVAKKLGIIQHNNTLLYNAHIKNVKNLHNMIANHGFHNDEYLYETYSKFRSQVVLIQD